MSRRLVKGSSSGRRTDNATTYGPSMPAYQPPAFPLSDEGRRALSSISSSGDLTGAYETQLARSLSHLPAAVATINDRLKARRDDVDAAARRRRNQGNTETTPADEQAEEALRRLEREVPRLARELEAADRAAIDAKRALLNLKAALREANTSVQQAQPRQMRDRTGGDVTTTTMRFEDIEDVDEFLATVRADADGEDDGGADQEEQRGPPAPLRLFKESRARLAAEYEAEGVFEKYAENNDYIAFKRHWHDGLHPNEDKAMPDASRWFDEDGNPRLDEDGGDDDDDDIAYGPAVTSTRCPITLLPFQEPITSKKCKHTFEKSAIVSMFRGQGEKDCPMGGCVKRLIFADFHEDPIMKRKIERAKQREARGAESDGEGEEGDDGDEPDASILETGTRNKGRPIKRELKRGSSPS
ncbi:hypothetical protein PpBr36_08099 [Pyricularia pennisetigena]|uniref:hypothetical protein n=1 Tax=Pyricularia pennisetigena TaxID=1578925 RepID=UPI001153DCF0|nr:hypothetical protein PpBr36_08099 [Pyricularia pennisetigena]TLS23994.1 hypothetical protein PpBr36_08099 [Pyricularia pennisetigena]